MASLHEGPALESPILRIAAIGWRAEVAEGAEGQEGAADWGAYTGVPPEIRLEDDGRRATLLSPMSYRRADGSQWPVPANSSLDGASIPRVFWSLIGGPFEGRYRNASIVHDRYCDTQERSWRDTHRMFYEAMRCSGTPAVQAKIMYYAVYRFGPRWEPGTEAAGKRAAIAATPLPLELEGAAADAEAIQRHGLDLAEIETLADFRNASGADTEETPGMLAAGAARARLVVIPGGSGTAEDAETVARSAERLSARVVDRFLVKGIRIVACRGSVTDFEQSLRGQVPRGWEGLGKTWDDVPGVYLDGRKRVVVATVAENGGRAVPLSGHGHGSCDLVLHESLHGYDYSGGHAVLGEDGFRSARTADLARLGTYEKQAGQAGLEETYAESGARFLAEPGALMADWPALFGYWSAEGPQEDIVIANRPPVAEEQSLGTAEALGDGRIRLDLRARHDEGVGHASFTLAPGNPLHQRVAELVGAETPGGEAAGPRLLPPRLG